MSFVNMVTRKMSDREELEYQKDTIEECIIFLKKWDVMKGRRTETVEDALIAITELEKNTRQRVGELVSILGEEITPF